jgi:glyceraldehyde 3-phosphate dehydrogenase
VTRRVAIHGFGRTGRQAFKTIWQSYRDSLEVAAIGVHDLDDAPAAAHLLQYDSSYGRFGVPVSVSNGHLAVGGERIPLVSAPSPAALPWQSLGVDIVIEATGAYVDNRLAAGHLEAGANKVIVTAPCEGADFTLIYGVNDAGYDPDRHHVISAGSDTTNALAPLVQALRDAFEVRNAMITAVRAYTNEQKLLDSADSDLRRARSAPTSIVPTTTRAATTIGQVFPDMAGRIGGYAVRVPVATVSILELTAELAEAPSAEAINDAFRRAAAGPLGRVLAVSDAPLVSSDFRGSEYSAVVDAPLTLTIGPLAKVSAWYDNEWGYSRRVADVAALVAQQDPRGNGRG